MGAITEKDEDGQVGTAAYERSKFMAEIVSLPPLRSDGKVEARFGGGGLEPTAWMDRRSDRPR